MDELLKLGESFKDVTTEDSELEFHRAANQLMKLKSDAPGLAHSSYKRRKIRRLRMPENPKVDQDVYLNDL